MQLAAPPEGATDRYGPAGDCSFLRVLHRPVDSHALRLAKIAARKAADARDGYVWPERGALRAPMICSGVKLSSPSLHPEPA